MALATSILIILTFAIVFGIIGWFIGSKKKVPVSRPLGYTIAYVIGGALFGYSILYLSATGLLAGVESTLEPLWDKLIEQPFNTLVSSTWHCVFGDPEKCRLNTMWEEPKIQSGKEEISIDVNFFKTTFKSGKSLDVIAELEVLNSPESDIEEVRIRPLCYLGDDKEEELEVIMEEGDEFVFEKSSKEQYKSLHCYAESIETEKITSAKKLVLELERPVLVDTKLPIWLSSVSKYEKGKVKSVMKYNAPYTVALAFFDSQPFKEGKKDFSIIIKKEQPDTEIKEIKWIKIKKASNKISISCDGFENIMGALQIDNLDRGDLRGYLVDEEEDKYQFYCVIDVRDAPDEMKLEDTIIAQSLYTVTSKYETTIKVVI